MNEQVTCFTMENKAVQIKKSKLSFRPSVYAIVLHEGKTLMTVTRSTGKFMPPGGGIDIGESIEQALQRELMEECGIKVEIIAPAFFKEAFFYYEPTDSAWQCYLFFFVCKPLSFDLSDHLNEQGDESEKPQWVDIKTLTAERIQVCGEEMMEFIQRL